MSEIVIYRQSIVYVVKTIANQCILREGSAKERGYLIN